MAEVRSILDGIKDDSHNLVLQSHDQIVRIQTLTLDAIEAVEESERILERTDKLLSASRVHTLS